MDNFEEAKFYELETLIHIQTALDSAYSLEDRNISALLSVSNAVMAMLFYIKAEFGEIDD